jgi:hypothetical protein
MQWQALHDLIGSDSGSISWLQMSVFLERNGTISVITVDPSV